MAHTLPTDMHETCDGLFYCLAEWANTVTDGLFWPGILVAFVVVLFLAIQRFGTPRSYGFASFVGLLGAIFLATLQLLAWWIATVFILAGAVGFAVMIVNER